MQEHGRRQCWKSCWNLYKWHPSFFLHLQTQSFYHRGNQVGQAWFTLNNPATFFFSFICLEMWSIRTLGFSQRQNEIQWPVVHQIFFWSFLKMSAFLHSSGISPVSVTWGRQHRAVVQGYRSDFLVSWPNDAYRWRFFSGNTSFDSHLLLVVLPLLQTSLITEAWETLLVNSEAKV